MSEKYSLNVVVKLPNDLLDPNPYQSYYSEVYVKSLVETMGDRKQPDVPIIVRRSPSNPDRFQIGEGHHRVGATRLLGEQYTLGIIQELTDRDMLNLVADNVKKRIVSDFEKGEICQSYLKLVNPVSYSYIASRLSTQFESITEDKIHRLIRMTETIDTLLREHKLTPQISYVFTEKQSRAFHPSEKQVWAELTRYTNDFYYGNEYLPTHDQIRALADQLVSSEASIPNPQPRKDEPETDGLEIESDAENEGDEPTTASEPTIPNSREKPRALSEPEPPEEEEKPKPQRPEATPENMTKTLESYSLQYGIYEYRPLAAHLTAIYKIRVEEALEFALAFTRKRAEEKAKKPNDDPKSNDNGASTTRDGRKGTFFAGYTCPVCQQFLTTQKLTRFLNKLREKNPEYAKVFEEMVLDQ